ncbi:MAG: hypothetical protein LC646_02355 [Xanthomonadaceae bacterium]|nr:hypothetical protein [Xanthomonadaceae bacterium]
MRRWPDPIPLPRPVPCWRGCASRDWRRVDYAAGEIPVLAVRLQEMFGCADTPRIAGGRVPVLLHLLSPARRPVQVTRDLASFWGKAYAEVKKDLKGRYPKHSWPDDPRQAEALRGTRPGGTR